MFILIIGLFHHLLYKMVDRVNNSISYESDDNMSYLKKQRNILDTINPLVNWSEVIQIVESDEPIITLHKSYFSSPDKYSFPSEDNKSSSSDHLLPSSNTSSTFYQINAVQVINFIQKSFLLTNRQLTNVLNTSSGTTATTVILFEKHVLVAHVGDSRVVACCGSAIEGSLHKLPIQLTVDHTPYCEDEEKRVVLRGGWIDKSNDIYRVNGKLAVITIILLIINNARRFQVTRSIGDAFLGDIISSVPDITLFRLTSPKTDNYTDVFNNRNKILVHI